MGAILQNTMPLIDGTNKDNCAIEGRLNISAIANLLGEGSFDHPLTAHWETLLTTSSPSSNLANGLQYAWSHLTNTFQGVALQEQLTDKLTHDTTRSGSYIG